MQALDLTYILQCVAFIAMLALSLFVSTSAAWAWCLNIIFQRSVGWWPFIVLSAVAVLLWMVTGWLSPFEFSAKPI